MLLSRVHWATHLFWPHTLRNRMIFRRKNWKCIISVFNQTALQLDGYSFHCFRSAGRRERSHGQRHTWLTQLFYLSLCIFCVPGHVPAEGFQRFMEARMDQPVWLALYLGPVTPLIEPRTCVCLKYIFQGSNHAFGFKTSINGESTISLGTLLLLDAWLINFRITNDF